MSAFRATSLVLALSLPLAAWAEEAPSRDALQTLRRDIAALRAAHAEQLHQLELRLQAAEAAAALPPSAPAAPLTPAAPMADTAALLPSAPTAVAPAAAPASFNPQISLILSGGYTRTRLDPAQWAVSGFALATDAEAGPGTRGFSLAETELGLSASIDPWLRGAVNLALHPDDAVSVEEAYLQSTALPSGFTLKAGRFLSGLGYLNEQHAHTWDFVDNPLAYQALLGTQLGDDGVQLRWLAPTDTFVELGAELGRGRGFPGSDSARNGAGRRTLFAHAGGDWNDSHSWRAGLSWLSAQASDQALWRNDSGLAHRFSGGTRVWVADAVWKWAPEGNAARQSVKLQGEYLRSTRQGQWTYDTEGLASTDAYRVTQSGWYVQGVWQFMPRWRLGARTERLDAGRAEAGVNTAALAGDGYRPSRQTLMLDFSASEFSRVRLQLAQDRAREGQRDTQLQLQYQMSLGAHGAHGY